MKKTQSTTFRCNVIEEAKGKNMQMEATNQHRCAMRT